MKGWRALGGVLGAQLKHPEARAAIQAATGFFVLLAALSAPAVWRSLSLPQALISPVYAVVSFSVVMQANVGTSLSYVVQRLAAAAVAAAAALACIALTLAANGGTYAPSTTKAAVMTTCSTLCGFLLALGAYRFPKFWFGFIVASLLLPIASLSAFHLDYAEWLTVPYFLMEVAIGVAVGAAVTMLVLPNTAAGAVTAGAAAAMRGLGQGTAALVDLLLADPTTDSDSSAAAPPPKIASAASLHRLASAAAHEVRPESIAEFVERWASPVSAALVKAKTLLTPVATEVSVYRKPRIFPREAYATLLGLLRHYLSTLMTLTYLAEGDAPLRAARALRGRAAAVAAAVDAALAAAAAVIAAEPGATYPAALDALDALEEQLLAASTLRVQDLAPPGEPPFAEGEMVMADTVIAVLFSLGSRVRKLFFVLPDALAGPASEEAWTAWRRHFKGKRWDFEMGAASPPGSPHALQTPALGARSPLAAQQLARLNSLPPSPAPLGGSPRRSPGAQQPGTARLRRALGDRAPSAAPPTPTIALSASAAAFPQPIPAVAAEPAAPDGLRSWARRARARWAALPPLTDASFPGGITGESVALSLQVWVALVGATLLHVCNASYEALNRTTIWIPVTVAVMAQKSVGGVALRGANRLAGTAGAGASGLAILYLVYAINGASYANEPAKFIAMTVLLSAASGALMYASLRAPHHYIYAFTVWKFTLAIVALAGYVQETLSARTAAFRIANIAIGLAIDFVATVTVFPVSTQGAVVRRVRRVLGDFADIAAGSSAKMLRGGSTLASSPSPGASGRLESRRPSSAATGTQSSSPELSPGPAVAPAAAGAARQPSAASGGSPGAVARFSFAWPSPPPLGRETSAMSVDGAADFTFGGGAGAGPPPVLPQAGMGVPQVAHPDPLPPLNLHVRTSFPPPRPPPASAPAASPGAASPGATATPFSAFAGAAPAPPAPPATIYVPREESTTEEAVVAALERSLSAPLSPTSPASPGWYAAAPPKAAPARAFRRQRTKWVYKIAFGRARPLIVVGQDAAALLEALAELEMITAFENRAFRLLGRRRGAAGGAGDPESLRAARRALRRMLNALLSFAYVLDGPDEPHLRLLLPFRPDIDALMAQMSECLRAVAGAAAGMLPLDRVEATQANLRAEALALVAEVEGAPPPPGSTQADVVMGFAALGVLVATIQTLAQTTEAVLTLCLPGALDALGDLDEGLIHIDPAPAGEFGGPGGEEGSSSEDLVAAGRRGGRGARSLPPGRSSQGALAASASMANVRAMRWSTSAQVLLGGGASMLGEPSMVDLVSAGHRGGADDDEDVEAARARLGHGD